MPQSLPLLLVPGLLCSARLYAPQIPALWPCGPVTVVDHRRDDSMEALARRILEQAPPRFALAGLSMGGYIALAVIAAAPERVAKLALLDTNARADTDEQRAGREKFIAMARAGKLNDVVATLLPRFLHRSHQNDAALRQTVRDMAAETGVEAFVRQQTAIMGRPDSRPRLGAIACPTLVLVGEGDELTPPAQSQEMAAAIPTARLVTVPDCGHLSTLEQPEAVNAAMRAWLES